MQSSGGHFKPNRWWAIKTVKEGKYKNLKLNFKKHLSYTACGRQPPHQSSGRPSKRWPRTRQRRVREKEVRHRSRAPLITRLMSPILRIEEEPLQQTFSSHLSFCLCGPSSENGVEGRKGGGGGRTPRSHRRADHSQTETPRQLPPNPSHRHARTHVCACAHALHTNASHSHVQRFPSHHLVNIWPGSKKCDRSSRDSGHTLIDFVGVVAQDATLATALRLPCSPHRHRDRRQPRGHQRPWAGLCRWSKFRISTTLTRIKFALPIWGYSPNRNSPSVLGKSLRIAQKVMLSKWAPIPFNETLI